MKNLIFLLEGPGKVMDIYTEHLHELRVNRAALEVLLEELGTTEFRAFKDTGALHSVQLHEKREDFTKPDRSGFSRPKRGTEWDKRFSELPKIKIVSDTIHTELGVPHSISYKTATGQGACRLGMPFRSCGFMWYQEANLAAMWIPDVASMVQDRINQGQTVLNGIDQWNPEFPGCKQIEQEEWDILIAQFKLAKKKEQK